MSRDKNDVGLRLTSRQWLLRGAGRSNTLMLIRYCAGRMVLQNQFAKGATT